MLMFGASLDVGAWSLELFPTDMLFAEKSPTQKRVEFRAALKSGRLLRFPGAFSPLVSMLIERQGFEGVYISGAVLANDLGLPDVGLTTLTEVSQRGRVIARATELPAIIDADTGFGESMNAARTVQELEELGLCGCHFEDQQNPKRCGHLDGKSLLPAAEMVKKIRAAAPMHGPPKVWTRPLLARSPAWMPERT
jgi:methylisocitrate lyase